MRRAHPKGLLNVSVNETLAITLTRCLGLLVLACAAQFDQYVLASSDLQFRFYDDTTLRLMKSCHTPTSQNCLKWYPETTTLFSAGVSGIVYAWDAERMEEKHHMGGEARGKVLTRSHDDIVLDLLSVRPSFAYSLSCSYDTHTHSAS